MPLFWRYIITNYLKIATAAMLAFIAILLTMQLNDVAHFAALGAPLTYIFLFTLYQIPYILPIALPLSCLISSFILMRRISTSHELTALRTSGFALRDILGPIWITAAFLTIVNFWIASELATHSHLQNNLLKSELRAINPLHLLNNKHLMRLKGFYFNALGDSRTGESASDAILAFPSKHNNRLNLMVAQGIKSSPSIFTGEGVSIISGMAGEEDETYDPLLIENMKLSYTHVKDFSDLIQKKVSTINNDYLQMPLLLARIREQQKLLPEMKLNKENKEKVKQLKQQLNRSMSEIMKRISIAIAVFSMSFMGTAFGLHIGRSKDAKPLYFVIALTTLYLIAFFVAKGIDHSPVLAATLYLAPHAIIIALSLIFIGRISRGVEG